MPHYGRCGDWIIKEGCTLHVGSRRICVRKMQLFGLFHFIRISFDMLTDILNFAI